MPVLAGTSSLAGKPQARTATRCCIIVFSEYEAIVTLTVRLDAALETKVGQEARRLGVTKSEFVKDALERVLGLKDPAALLKAVRGGRPMGDPNASQDVSAKVKARLREKRSD